MRRDSNVRNQICLGFLVGAISAGIVRAETTGPSAAPAPDAPTMQNLKPSTDPAWTSKCISAGRSAPLMCSAEETMVLVNTGQVVASVAVRMQPGSGDPVLVIRVPVGLYLPAGLHFKIDDGEAQNVP